MKKRRRLHLLLIPLLCAVIALAAGCGRGKAGSAADASGSALSALDGYAEGSDDQEAWGGPAGDAAYGGGSEEGQDPYEAGGSGEGQDLSAQDGSGEGRDLSFGGGSEGGQWFSTEDGSGGGQDLYAESGSEEEQDAFGEDGGPQDAPGTDQEEGSRQQDSQDFGLDDDFQGGGGRQDSDGGGSGTEDGSGESSADGRYADIYRGAGTEGEIDENGVYTTAEDVALYIHTYGKLPSNFMTKKEARSRGWRGGSLEQAAPGMCIGGDRFGNYEKILPEGSYHECDINTLGKKNRGAERLIYSSDGRIYYTKDHYETFTLLY